MTACLFNLIIYTNNQQRAEFFHEIINILITKFPCRVIFIEIDDTQTTENPEISKYCVNDRCEQIKIRTSLANLNRVPYIVLASLAPDLPVYLIWGQNPKIPNPILPDLMKLATRMIYDSECSDDLKEFSEHILSNLKTDKIDFMDIDWALIRGWRDVIAKTFDSADKLEILKRCTSIKIYYNEIPSVFVRHNSNRAYYLQGWIAAQMGWKFLSLDKSKTLTYQNGNLKTAVNLEQIHHSETPPGTLVKIIFATEQREEIVMSKIKDQSMVLVHITCGDKCELPFSFRLPNFQRGLSFIKEIFYFRSSDHYKNMLEVLQKIDWKD